MANASPGLRRWKSLTGAPGHRPVGEDIKLHESPKARLLRLAKITPYGGSALFRATCADVPRSLFPDYNVLLGVNKRGVHFFDAGGSEYLHSVTLQEVCDCGVEGQKTLRLDVAVGEGRYNDKFVFSCAGASEVVALIRAHKGRTQAQMGGKGPGSDRGAMNISEMYGESVYARTMSSPELAKRKEKSEGVGETRERSPARGATERSETAAEQATTSEQSTPVYHPYHNRDGASSSSSSSPAGEGDARKARVYRVVRAQQNVARREREEWQAAVLSGRNLTRELLEEVKGVNAEGGRDAFPAETVAKLEGAVAKLERELEVVDEGGGGGKGKEKVVGGGGFGEGDERVVEEAERMRRRVEELEGTLRAAEARAEALSSENEALAESAALMEAERQNYLDDISAEREAARLAMEQVNRLQVGLRAAEEKLSMAGALEGELQTLRQLYRDESLLRKRYFSQIEDMKGKIRVLVRIRPHLIDTDINNNGSPPSMDTIRGAVGSGDGPALVAADDLTVSYAWNGEQEARKMSFDGVLDGSVGQEGVYSRCGSLVQCALDGYNCSLIAHGQTGSGKSYTVFGRDGQPGVASRAADQLFATAEAEAGRVQYRFRCVMLELYNNALKDLLQVGREAEPALLEIKKDPDGLVWVQGATMVEVSSADEVRGAIAAAFSRLRMADETCHNRHSSRSHILFSLVVESSNLLTGVHSRGKLSLVELAGSERIESSDVSEERIKEEAAINNSLSALGDVVTALVESRSHIPYNNHKLTKLLSDSLGGNAKTVMIVTLSPELLDLPESHSSLQFAARFRKVQNCARQNSESREIQRLRAEVEHWREQAGMPMEMRQRWDFVDIVDARDEDRSTEIE